MNVDCKRNPLFKILSITYFRSSVKILDQCTACYRHCLHPVGDPFSSSQNESSLEQEIFGFFK